LNPKILWIENIKSKFCQLWGLLYKSVDDSIWFSFLAVFLFSNIVTP
jgi:hypothetical protein